MCEPKKKNESKKYRELNMIKNDILEVIEDKKKYALLKGDCRQLLGLIPDNSIDCVITSPPYWKMREYDVDEEFKENLIGYEDTPEEYVKNIKNIFIKIKRVLKTEGSVWLNIGDKFYKKNLMGMPWRVALSLQKDGWILRNNIIWNKMKGTQSAKDRLRHNYEQIFHFVKNKKYYFNRKEILIKPNKVPTIKNGKIVSATGVNGSKYRRQILKSQILNETERQNALKALDFTLEKMKKGEIVDFRMTIRGEQRTYHSNNTKISGRAKELLDKGYYILKSHSEGYMPSNIWNIVPEDEWRKDVHYAVFPIELLKLPIKATCPVNGIILDPFVGIGSTILASRKFLNRAIGMDISTNYIEIAKKRLKNMH